MEKSPKLRRSSKKHFFFFEIEKAGQKCRLWARPTREDDSELRLSGHRRSSNLILGTLHPRCLFPPLGNIEPLTEKQAVHICEPKLTTKC